MTIKQKVRLSNIMMVLIPIFFTAVVIGVCLQTSLGSYWHTLETMYSDENGVQFAQSMIYTYQQELWEANWGQGEPKGGTGEINWSDKMNHMKHKLSGMGYYFMITKNDRQIFSNISAQDMEVARSVAGNAIDSAKTLTASRHEVSIIKNTFYHEGKVFCITAVHPAKTETDQEVVAYLKNYILKYVYGFVIFFVVLSLCVNGIMSWWISKSILKPLGKLSRGTKEIREGNLDKALEYEKNDEFGSVCRDFDDMRVYLKESVDQRLKDEKRRKELITGISHDLRTPLASISGYLDGLMDGIANTPEKRIRYLQAIKIRTGNMVSLVDSLSEYCRLDSSSFHYHLETAELKSFIEQYLSAYDHEAEENKVKIQFLCKENAYWVRIDRNELKRVLDNLFANTIRYRETEGSRVYISLNKKEQETIVEIVFGDDGPGVPMDSLERVFDSFYRVDDSRNKSEKGSGIGLAVAKEIVLGHGGTIKAENHSGLAIVIRLPLTKEDTNETSADS